ncbi:MAG: ATP-binding protein [Ilumatobacteraceae bacterium]
MTRRLILSYLAITVAVLIILEVPFAVFFAQRERDRLTANLERDAYVMATVYEDFIEVGVVPDPRRAEEYASATGARVIVVDETGLSLVDTAEPTPQSFATRPEIAAALSGERATGTRRSESLGTDLLFVSIPIAANGSIQGAVRLTLDTSEVDDRIERFWWGLLGIAAVVVVAITLIGWLIARSVTLPLRRLNETARRFGSGDLRREKTESQGPPELQELAATMTDMAEQLAQLIEQQRAFVADASHQLRTPLTGLRLRLENLQATLATADSTQIDLAIDEIARLSNVVNDLLRLARADRGDVAVPHDLTTIVSERVNTWTAVAETADIHLDFQQDEKHLVVLAVPGAIEQILDNVLDNAISIAPARTTVSIVLESGISRHRLSIRDQGPGLSDEDKILALRRFWRGDNQRPGSGLGLAIAEGLARSSGGSLELHDSPSGGLRVDVLFPAVVS